eukprot:6792699-Pyramimonas_sp.AAC.1
MIQLLKGLSTNKLDEAAAEEIKREHLKSNRKVKMASETAVEDSRRKATGDGAGRGRGAVVGISLEIHGGSNGFALDKWISVEISRGSCAL